VRNQTQLFFGLLVILIGVLFLIGNLFDVNIGVFCWPVGLILIGLWLIMRPRLAGPDTGTHFILIGDVERAGKWPVANEEFYSFIADMDLDFSKADVPLGETNVRAYGFIGDIELYVPEDVGLAVHSSAFVTSFRVIGQDKEDNFLAPLNWQSENYKLAERKIRFEGGHFIADIKVRLI
jgi:lia operon protein LiaF